MYDGRQPDTIRHFRFGETIMTFLSDLKFAIRSLSRSKGVAITVVLTLALGIAQMPRSSAWCAAYC